MKPSNFLGNGPASRAGHDDIGQDQVEGRIRRCTRGKAGCAIGRPSDGVAEALELMDDAAANLLVVRGTGAYGAAMSIEYNARPRAAEVMVEGATSTVIRRRGRYEDLHHG